MKIKGNVLRTLCERNGGRGNGSLNLGWTLPRYVSNPVITREGSRVEQRSELV
ncbi:MAG: hypothetical protein A4E55_01814 [Pelotomaculum sp. PtaU1.Bin035]|nr:MAG: hypothetical protein A4E55_01814 [Pelotomaculum sp. PtaU1.Bin035]